MFNGYEGPFWQRVKYTAQDFKRDHGDTVIGVGILSVAAGVVYAAVAGLLNMAVMLTANDEIVTAKNRNMDVFNQMSDVQDLNTASRAAPWWWRQASITKDIVLQGRGGWEWWPRSLWGSDYKSVAAMDRAGIALVPAAQPGVATHLVVDESHGCLVVDFTKSDTELANEARALLQDFNKRSASAYAYLGRYTLDKTTVRFAPIGADFAFQTCPRPTL